MTMLIQHAHVLGAPDFDGDVLIENGRFAALGTELTAPVGAQVIDAKGQTLMPGLVDVHVHFREPGFTDKETIKTGAAAAAHGGYTTVVAMPNLDPVPDRVETLQPLLAKNQTDAVINVRQFAAITAGLRSTDLVDYAALKSAGALGFSNDGVGVQEASVMLHAMEGAAAVDAPIVAHIEDDGIKENGVINAGPVADRLGLPGIPNTGESAQLARDLALAEATGVHYHACHISTKESVALIADAKRRGVNVTAEVTPHHLLLDETDIPGDNPAFKMNPPLRSVADHEALIQGLLDGTLDMIATDHAPHTAADKSGSFTTAAFGIVGSETAFALLYTQFVLTHRFTLHQLVNWMSTVPAQTFALPGGVIAVGQPADCTLVNLDYTGTVDPSTWLSKSQNSPFIGRPINAQVTLTVAGGQVAFSTH